MAEKNIKVGSLPEFVTKDNLCLILGLTSRRVEQLQEDGIFTRERMGSRVVYELVPNVSRYTKYLADKAYGRETKANEKELKKQKLLAEIALKESQGELHSLRTEIAKGNYISVEEVKADYTRFFVVFKTFATGLPSKLAGRLSGILASVEVRQIENELQNEVKMHLGSFVSRAINGTTESADLDPTKPKKMGRPKKNGK